MEEKLIKQLIQYKTFVEWLQTDVTVDACATPRTHSSSSSRAASVVDRAGTRQEDAPYAYNTSGSDRTILDRINKIVNNNLSPGATSARLKEAEDDYYLISQGLDIDNDGVQRDEIDLDSMPSPALDLTSSAGDRDLDRLHPQLRVFHDHDRSIDFIITFGGDGLLLYVNTLFQSRAIPPVMCFDFGSLGFLTPFEYQHFAQEVDGVLNGTALVTLRMRLECTIFRYNQSRGVYHVLNEAVIDRGPSPFLSVLDLNCDDQYLTTLQGDGVIFGTPTGSTAYSLAAGGSIVFPAVPAILLTPICAHSLSFRPMVLPDSAVLVCDVPRECRASGWVSFDGKYRQELHRGNRLQVRMSPHPMPTINKKSFTGDWFDALRAGFMFNMRPRQKPR
jgi:NAD+ kinase